MTTTFIIVILGALFIIGAVRFTREKKQEIQEDQPSTKAEEKSSESPYLTTQLKDESTYAEVYQTPAEEVKVETSVEEKPVAKKISPKKETPAKKTTEKKSPAKPAKTAKKTTAKKPTK